MQYSLIEYLPNFFFRELSDKNRQMIHRIVEARGEVAVMWEDRLMYVILTGPHFKYLTIILLQGGNVKTEN